MKIITSFAKNSDFEYFYSEAPSVFTEDLMFVNSFLYKALFKDYTFYTHTNSLKLVKSSVYNNVKVKTISNPNLDFPSGFWCAPKISANIEQKQSFIQSDIDILPWEKKWASFDSDFLFYSMDLNKRDSVGPIFKMYKKGLDLLSQIKRFDVFDGAYNNENGFYFDIYNQGVIGCNDIEFYKLYIEELRKIFSYKSDIENVFSKRNEKVYLCVILEQLLLSKMIFDNGKTCRGVYHDIGHGMRIPMGSQSMPMTHLMSLKRFDSVHEKIKKMKQYINENLTKTN